MCSVSVVTVVFIHTMEDDQRLNTLVHEGDTLHFSLQHCKTENTLPSFNISDYGCYRDNNIFNEEDASYLEQPSQCSEKHSKSFVVLVSQSLFESSCE